MTAVSVLYQLCQLQMSILRRDSEEKQMVGAEVNGDCKTQQKSLDTISGNKIETSKILYNGTQISLYQHRVMSPVQSQVCGGVLEDTRRGSHGSPVTTRQWQC